LDKRGQAPRTFRIGSRRRISEEADAAGRAAREAEASPKARKIPNAPGERK
jgi:hypothetical protein